MIPKRFRRAFVVAAATSLASVGLAIGPNLGGRYDPQTAVLAATAIAVIWYTYFTYCAVHREEPGRLLLGIEFSARATLFRPIVQNQTARTMRARLHLDAWVDQKPVPSDEFYSGQDEFIVAPYQQVTGVFSFREQLSGQIYDPLTNTFSGPPPGPGIVLVRLWATWVDDLDDTGKSPEHYWRVDRTTGEVSAVLGAKARERVFGPVLGLARGGGPPQGQIGDGA